MLLGVGRKRVFSPHVSLIQMLRAFSDWNAQAAQTNRLQLVICMVDPGPIHLLCSGRLDPAEVIAVHEVRFWVEICRSAEEIQRYLEFAVPNETLRDVLKRYDLPSDGWRALIVPTPIMWAKEIGAGEIMGDVRDEEWTVSNAGLMPGSTLRILPDSVQI